MADQDLRRAERDAAQGDVEARARLLAARLRQGEADADRLRLAALLGDEAAAAAVETEGDLYEALLACGKQAAVRLALASARLVLPLWFRLHPELEAEGPDPLRWLDAAAEFARCPCEEHATADAIFHSARPPNLYTENPPIDERPLGPSLEYAADAAAQAAFLAAVSASPRAPEGVKTGLPVGKIAAHYASSALKLSRRAAQEALGGAGEARARGLLREAARIEVVPWLLGEDDPLAAPEPTELPDVLGLRRPDPKLSEPAYLGRCVGSYRRGRPRLSVVLEGERLTFQASGNEARALVPEVRRVFRVEDTDQYVEFVTDDDDQPAHALRHTNRRWGTRTAPRID
jgi:hypothetical protein